MRHASIVSSGTASVILVTFLGISLLYFKIQVDRLIQNVTFKKANDESTIVLYNRIPKTGSTTFMKLIQNLTAENGVNVVLIDITRHRYILSLQDQYKLAKEITSNPLRRTLYQGHFAYVDFRKFGVDTNHFYVSIARKPFERLVSHYYFLRFGDDFRVGLKRIHSGDNTTFDECVQLAKKDSDCAFKKLWKQIPFFCGHAAECWKVGSEWALRQAKKNIVENHILVGTTEQMKDFLVLLEDTLPNFFSGIYKKYLENDFHHIRKTLHKETPSQRTIEKFKRTKAWKMEMELYNFIKQRLNSELQRAKS